MDLNQSKLTRIEWDSIEIPVSEQEKGILNMIIEGYNNLNITQNKTTSLFSFTKIEHTPENEQYLYDKYFSPIIERTIRKYCGNEKFVRMKNWSYKNNNSSSGSSKKMKNIDSLRIQNLESNIDGNKKIIYEFLVLDFCNELCKYLSKTNTKYAYYLYTLIQLVKATIHMVHPGVIAYIDVVVSIANEHTDLSQIVERAFVFIEQNPYLLEYEDKTLFSHQKELFSIFHNEVTPKLVLYIAPTGTGKTLSPIGLSVKYRILFVCVARHIGLALAKSAISMEKKVAFAFGAETASDIRLHWFSASDFTKDRRSGSIRKVNNAIGDKVEIMICDVQSYLIAMQYMLAFNPADKIITYWDEPTITMDYDNHELHSIIHKNWVENKIPNMVLSCATLPHEEEIVDSIIDFKCRFSNAEIYTVASYDCKKSIPMITKMGFCAMPHTLYESYDELVGCVDFCSNNKTLLRYFDLSEIVSFIFYINKKGLVNDRYKIKNYFPDIASITMNSIKLYYLILLKNIPRDEWDDIYKYNKSIQRPKFSKKVITKNDNFDSDSIFITNTPNINGTIKYSDGVLITTNDAYTLTDGPTIFLSEDARKIGQFYTQQSSIPQSMFKELLTKIDSNNKYSTQIDELERTIEALTQSDSDKKTKQKSKDDDSQPQNIRDLYRKVETLYKHIKSISLEPEYVPNTNAHQNKWMGETRSNVFCPPLSEDSIKDVMALSIETPLKVMMLLGIGLFVEGVNPKYLEIMKRLATNQYLFMIIASSDFVFGTNYNFCHGFIGKDMINMTQAKTIQCLGRIGRSSIQSTYTARFRDDSFIYNLFKKPSVNIEAINMSRLFSSYQPV
jgi:hypothetical protein